jgi:hypothetical protein
LQRHRGSGFHDVDATATAEVIGRYCKVKVMMYLERRVEMGGRRDRDR